MQTRSFSKILGVLLLSAALLITSAAEAIVHCKMTFGNRKKPTDPINRFRNTFDFADKKIIIGMIHLAGVEDDVVVARALHELKVFEDQGVHAAIIENYHGRTYQVEMVLKAAKGKFPNLVLGVNILPNEYAKAFRLAREYGAEFIQLDFVAGRYYGAKDRAIQMDYKDYLSYRNSYPDILVLGGVHPKYYEPVFGSDLTEDIRIAQWVSDAIVVTGAGTGKATPLEKIKQFRTILGPNFPLVIGAGVTVENAPLQMPYGDAAIIGSYFKNGETYDPVDPARVREIKNVFIQVEGKGNP